MKHLPRKLTFQQFVEEARNSGLIFAIEFIRRTDGKLEAMTCRTGVKKGLKPNSTGKGMGYDPKQHGLLSVYSLTKKGFRSIPIDGIQRLSMRGQRFHAINNEYAFEETSQ